MAVCLSVILSQLFEWALSKYKLYVRRSKLQEVYASRCRNEFCSDKLIEPLHKSHNAPVPYPTMQHFNRNVHVCTFLLQNGALWDICLIHFWVNEVGLLQQYFKTTGNYSRYPSYMYTTSGLIIIIFILIINLYLCIGMFALHTFNQSWEN